ncbi:sensor domain-containing protein [Mycobacterium rhizamassiliense]|jgi:hypothetical protein|uniref:Sensor domain-containing protein n=1 Tax=Mycobacterium rhizamassiliense TaxID=1841860 RepID=A0A2U3NWN3_9MYCO|nr:sensor domain-containing protein [Mycobacterium rhizamassiliense]SPM35927.1 sensor domain-containing protein [Mycobacterium rhizamassiliense]
MRMVKTAATLVTIAALSTGCTTIVDGAVQAAPTLKPHPISGETVARVLLNEDELSRMLKQPFISHGDLDVGGPEKLFHRDETISPAGCLGVTAMMQRSVYGSAQVTDAASASWLNYGLRGKVITVIEGAVALGSVAQARALFTQFAQQWQQCDGTTAIDQAGPITTTNVISDVRVVDSVVAATNTATSVGGNLPPLLPTPQARVIGVRANCLVEVEVVFFANRRSSDAGSGDLDTSGIDVAHAMMDKVSALS